MARISVADNVRKRINVLFYVEYAVPICVSKGMTRLKNAVQLGRGEISRI